MARVQTVKFKDLTGCELKLQESSFRAGSLWLELEGGYRANFGKREIARMLSFLHRFVQTDRLRPVRMKKLKVLTA